MLPKPDITHGVCNNAYVGSMCHSNIQIDDRTNDFPAAFPPLAGLLPIEDPVVGHVFSRYATNKHPTIDMV